MVAPPPSPPPSPILPATTALSSPGLQAAKRRHRCLNALRLHPWRAPRPSSQRHRKRRSVGSSSSSRRSRSPLSSLPRYLAFSTWRTPRRRPHHQQPVTSCVHTYPITTTHPDADDHHLTFLNSETETPPEAFPSHPPSGPRALPSPSRARGRHVRDRLKQRLGLACCPRRCPVGESRPRGSAWRHWRRRVRALVWRSV